MPLNLAIVDGETGARRKLIAKAVAFLAEPPDRGEMHELKTLFEVLDERLVLGDLTICSLPAIHGHRYFSRAAWKPRKLGNTTVSSLQRILFIDKPSKVYNGTHEIDAVLEHAKGGNAMVLVECKAGSARSTGAQTNAYLEFLLEESKPNVTSHYFAYCKENSLPPTPADYWPFFHRVFKGIAQISSVVGTPGTATTARPYFGRMSLVRTGQPLLDLNDVLDVAVRDQIIPENPVNEVLKVKALNALLNAKAAIRLQIFHVKRASPSGIARMTRKATQEVMRTARQDESTFWASLLDWLRDKE